MKKIATTFLFTILSLIFISGRGYAPAGVKHSEIGDEVSAPNNLKLKLVGKHQHFSASAEGYDQDINSPKSINIHPNGKKYYVNSLEGCKTVVYDMDTHKKLKVIEHKFDGTETNLWATPSGFYNFTHYEASNAFGGKPVESTFSHGGKYLWIPYYRRSFDINAQDPSAIAVIDTKTDEIIRMFETGPLPKMIATSHDSKTIAISHWGNNTVALIDINSENPTDWHHRKMVIVDYILPLNYSTKFSVDRDNSSGYCLRGTVFTPDDKYLFVGCMGGSGGVAVIDLTKDKYLGRVCGMKCNIRHIVIKNNYIYLSANAAGCIQRAKLDSFRDAACKLDGDSVKKITFNEWETCQVGSGARTIELSPSGNYAFAACNNASKLYVVDTREMKTITYIDVDSYPVGLDISDDGRYVIVTSQGRNRKGGNAVNIFEVTYPEPEPIVKEDTYTPNQTDSTVLNNNDIGGVSSSSLLFILASIVAILIVGIGVALYKKEKYKNKSKK